MESSRGSTFRESRRRSSALCGTPCSPSRVVSRSGASRFTRWLKHSSLDHNSVTLPSPTRRLPRVATWIRRGRLSLLESLDSSPLRNPTSTSFCAYRRLRESIPGPARQVTGVVSQSRSHGPISRTFATRSRSVRNRALCSLVDTGTASTQSPSQLVRYLTSPRYHDAAPGPVLERAVPLLATDRVADPTALRFVLALGESVLPPLGVRLRSAGSPSLVVW